MFYLLHCLPGPVEIKTLIFAQLKGNLSPDRVLYGTTILGQGVCYNALESYLMDMYNSKGIYGNADDSEKVIVEGLRENFEEVE